VSVCLRSAFHNGLAAIRLRAWLKHWIAFSRSVGRNSVCSCLWHELGNATLVLQTGWVRLVVTLRDLLRSGGGSCINLSRYLDLVYAKS
jgi:hypothetical protein